MEQTPELIQVICEYPVWAIWVGLAVAAFNTLLLLGLATKLSTVE